MNNWSTRSFLGGAVFGAGYVPAPVDISETHVHRTRTDRQDHDAAWAALTRSGGLPLLIGQFAVIAMAVASGVSIVNAFLVRLLGVNVFGQPEIYVPGWAFVTVLVSFGFFVTNIAICAELRVMYVLLDQSDTRPVYTVQRFGRIS